MRLRSQAAIIIAIVLFILPIASSWAQNAAEGVQDTTHHQKPDSTLESTAQPSAWTERRLIGTVLSVLIPGSGQTYLGHAEKGAAFTLATLACGLVTGLSENNIVGRNERLNELKAQYQIATNYVGADTLWQKMVSTKSLLDDNVRRRDLFLKLTVAFWVANVLDVIFFSDDKGEKPFGLLETGRGATLALVPDPRNGVNAVFRIQF